MESDNMPSPTVQSQKSSPVSLLEVTVVVLVTFALFLILGTALYLLNIGVSLVVSELLFLIVPLAYLLFKHINVKSYVGAELKPKFFLLGLGLGFVLLLIDALISGTLATILGPSQAVEQANKIITDLSKSPTGLIAIATSLSLAGVCEEFTFRGFLQNTINRRYSFWPAVLVSATVFGLAHFDPQLVYTLSTFIIGLLLGYVYHRWNSYVVSATAHSTVNIMVLIALLLSL